MNGSGIHSSLLQSGNNYGRKSFIAQAKGAKWPLQKTLTVTVKLAVAVKYNCKVRSIL